MAIIWRHLRKDNLLRDTNRRHWSDAAHNARNLINAYDMYRSWVSTYFLSLPVQCKSVYLKYCHKRVKTADLGWHVCSTIRQLLPNDVTYGELKKIPEKKNICICARWAIKGQHKPHVSYNNGCSKHLIWLICKFKIAAKYSNSYQSVNT